MANTIDLSQGPWRWHIMAGIVSQYDLLINPAQPSGTNTDVLLSFTKKAADLRLEKEELSFIGEWLLGAIASKEDAWDVPEGKGIYRAKVFPAVNAAGWANQVIEIFQTEYVWTSGDYEGDLTIYTGRLYLPTPPQTDPPTPPPLPVFYGFGADNAGRQWLTFGLTQEPAAAATP